MPPKKRPHSAGAGSAVGSTPGPGDYTPAAQHHRRRQASWGFAGADRHAPLPRRDDETIQCRADDWPLCNMAGQGEAEKFSRRGKDLPGPGTYYPANVEQVRGLHFNGPDYMTPPVTPGPGDYTPRGDGAAIPNRAFGVRPVDYGMIACLPACDSPGPAEYHGPKQRSALSRPDTYDGNSARSPSHAFAVDQSDRQVYTDASSSTKVIKPPERRSPGPGTYDIQKCSREEFGNCPKRSLTARRWYNSHLNPKEDPRSLSSPAWGTPRRGRAGPLKQAWNPDTFVCH